MRRYVHAFRRSLVGVLVATVLLLCPPAVAFGWAGWPHATLSDDTTWFLSPDERNARGFVGYPYINRVTAMPVLPELDAMGAWWAGSDPTADDPYLVEQQNKIWVAQNGMKEDDYDLLEDYWESPPYPPLFIDCTVTHFWDPEDDGGILNPVEGTWPEVFPNSWTKVKILWVQALNFWQAGDLGSAYAYLGHCLHLVQDQGIPCHAKDDWHAISDDSMEDWFSDSAGRTEADLMYSWTGRAGLPEPPGGILFPLSNEEVLATTAAVGFVDVDFIALLPYNVPQLFYLMYTVNQYGDFSPSDGYDGDASDPTGWADYTDPLILWQNDEGEPLTGAGSADTLDDNDPGDTNADGDYTDILNVGWRAVVRVSPAVIDLFRDTVDDVAPVTSFTVERVDGEDVVEWNNSPVTVTLTGAEDGAKPGWRPAGLWKVWGECGGETPSFVGDTPYFAVNEDGKHLVKLLSTDMVGNTEGAANDFTVGVDLTPPEIAFPDLRPNYLTSQDFVPQWDATDATSGVASEMGYLDGRLVEEGVPIDLALMAGKHRLEVWVSDVATNMRYEYYDFEVWIDTETNANPVNLQTKTKGAGMMVTVEFPAPYDVGAVDLSTCRLSVGATIDLEQAHPVVGAIVTLDGTLLTGVGDHDADGIPDRMIRFNKAQFAEAVAGQTGDVQAVVWGGLLPDGTPRFIGAVTVPVFTTP
jgi:hypothetical protein